MGEAAQARGTGRRRIGEPPGPHGPPRQVLQLPQRRLGGDGEGVHGRERQRDAASNGAAGDVSARPFIQEKMGGQQLNDQYFCQRLLPDYIKRARRRLGHHLRRSRALRRAAHEKGRSASAPSRCATISARSASRPGRAVRRRVGGCVTRGPQGRFGAVLFIEKEGFMPLFEAVHLAERYDLAIMSTKGSRTLRRAAWSIRCAASRDPAARAARLRQERILDPRNAAAGHPPLYLPNGSAKVIDLGLRLKDVRDSGSSNRRGGFRHRLRR